MNIDNMRIHIARMIATHNLNISQMPNRETWIREVNQGIELARLAREGGFAVKIDPDTGIIGSEAEEDDERNDEE